MSKYNRTLKEPRSATTNLAGGAAYVETEKLELASIALTSFLKDQFYRTADETVSRIVELVLRDPLFAAKAAIYARHEMGMRSVSHLIAAEVGCVVKGEQWTKRFYDRVVRRPDDVLEILACYKFRHPLTPIPNSMKKGLGAALARFDGYQIAKYKKQSADITLIDAVNLLHPKHTEHLGALMKGTLASPETWEVQMTQAGSDAGAKTEVWRNLVSTRKIGYFALLRNLRNIIEQAPDLIDAVCELLTDRKLIKQSLVLPFRFQTAIDALDQNPHWKNKLLYGALSDAVDISLENVPRFEGSTLIALDDSSSMLQIGAQPAKVGALFAVTMLKAMPDADLLCFSTDARYVHLNTGDSTLSMVKLLRSQFHGGGTNFHAIFQRAQRVYNRVIILSDMQGWMKADALYNYGRTSSTRTTLAQTFKQYCDRFEYQPLIYSFDLAGYGTLQFPERGVFCFAGFGDKTMEILSKLDSDRNALVNTIESVTI